LVTINGAKFMPVVMKPNVFRSAGHFGLEEHVIPKPSPGEAVMQLPFTTRTWRFTLARQYGATVTVQTGKDPAAKLEAIKVGRGVDVACVDVSNAPGVQEAFESALRALRPAGTLSSVGVACGHVRVPPDASGAVYHAICGMRRLQPAIVTTLRPGGKERMTRIMRPVRAAHLFKIESHRHNVLKVGIRVS
jgi:D-arabinose 1-dehydrogenase-like Zn-dependent alcohol dehydrogenase